MRRILSCLVLTCLLAGAWSASARAQDSTATTGVRDTTAARPPSRIYYGGALTLSISRRLTQVSVQPFVGYKLDAKASLGARASYEYFKDSRIVPSAQSHSYGGGIFSRYRFVPQAYGQVELSGIQYDWSDSRGRDFVPFFLVGGGYAQPIGPRTWLTVDVMFDLLQDEGSPYRDSTPRVTTGITANF